MSRRTGILLACCLALASAALVASGISPQGAPSSIPTASPGRVFGEPVAVRIELTITDQVGTNAPTKKTISMLAADGERASVRATNRTRNNATAQFSIDAKPMLVPTQDKVRVDLTLIYDLPEVPINPPAAAAAADKDAPQPWMTSLSESIGVILDNGKALVISQSADPRTDRKVTVEVKATVLR